jgi:RimJ/RimL family protein N-acetyltransferase
VSGRVHVETERLRLREWTDADAEPFAKLNADPRVMEFFPALLSRSESDALIERIRGVFAEHGYGLFAAELKADGSFIGFIGLAPVNFTAAFTPAIELGWRLKREAWGQGLASEGARGVRDHAFANLGFDGLVAFTAEWNQPSRRVMERIGMTRDPDGDFLHPRIAPDHKLARHVLYRITRGEWRAMERR